MTTFLTCRLPVKSAVVWITVLFVFFVDPVVVDNVTKRSRMRCRSFSWLSGPIRRRRSWRVRSSNFAKQGERDPARLRQRTLEALTNEPPAAAST
jgi:hypothetical protein